MQKRSQHTDNTSKALKDRYTKQKLDTKQGSREKRWSEFRHPKYIEEFLGFSH